MSISILICIRSHFAQPLNGLLCRFHAKNEKYFIVYIYFRWFASSHAFAKAYLYAYQLLSLNTVQSIHNIKRIAMKKLRKYCMFWALTIEEKKLVRSNTPISLFHLTFLIQKATSHQSRVLFFCAVVLPFLWLDIK